MKPTLIAGDGFAQASEQIQESFRLALSDLDTADLLCVLDKDLSSRQALTFIERYFSTDVDEIAERGAFLDDVRSADLLKKSYVLCQTLIQDDSQYQRAGYKLAELAYGLRRAKGYISLLEALSAMLADAPKGSRALELKQYVLTTQSEKDYQTIVTALNEIAGILTLPRHIYVGINVKEDFSATDFSIVKTEVGDENEPALNSLLSPETCDQKAISLSPEFFYTSDLYGNHFDEYFAEQLEKELHTELSKAQKFLSSCKLEHLDELKALNDDLYFYWLGKASAEHFCDLGFSVCAPNPHGDCFEAVSMLYPALVLNQSASESKPVANDVHMAIAECTVITGANHSGKTSYLKTIGQCLTLAQLGFKVPAKSLTFKPFKRLFTLFSAGEDDSMDVSRMGVEIQKITDIVSDACADDLIFLNEPLTSTNPLEAVAICAELCERFYAKGATVLLVTHLYDVYYVLRNNQALPTLKSLITNSVYDEKAGHMSHSYVIREAEPEGHSYARETAVDFGITLEAMIADTQNRATADAYLSQPRQSSLYEKEVK